MPKQFPSTIFFLVFVFLVAGVQANNVHTDIRGTGTHLVETVYEDLGFYYGFVDSSIELRYPASTAKLGRKLMLARKINFAGVDYPLPPDEQIIAKGSLVRFPSFILPGGIAYFAPDLPPNLRMSRRFMLRMYCPGPTVRTPFWDDPELAALNPGVALPHVRMTLQFSLVDPGVGKMLKETLKKISAAEGIPYPYDTDETIDPWPVHPSDIVYVEEEPHNALAGIRNDYYRVVFHLRGDIEEKAVNMFVMVNALGQDTYPDDQSVLNAVAKGKIDFSSGEAHLDCIDTDPRASNVWPLTYISYILMERAAVPESGTCVIQKGLVGFFSWMQTNSLAIDSINKLGTALPFDLLRQTLLTLELNITCNGALASPGGTVLVGTSNLFATYVDVMAADFGRVEPNYPVVSRSLPSSKVTSYILNNAADHGVVCEPIDEATLTANKLFQIPIATTAIVIVFNIPGLDSARTVVFGMDVISGLFDGSITYWDHPLILRDNWSLIDFFGHEKITVFIDSDDDVGAALILAIREYNPSFLPGSPMTTADIAWPSTIVRSTSLITDIPATAWSIGAMTITDSKINNFRVASMVNKAGKIVQPTKAALQAAGDETFGTSTFDSIATKGSGSIDFSNNKDAAAWPLMASFYLVSRKEVPLGMSCSPYSWGASLFAWILTDTAARQTLMENYLVVLPVSKAQLFLTQLASTQCLGAPIDFFDTSTPACPIVEGSVCGGTGRGRCDLVGGAIADAASAEELSVGTSTDSAIKCVCTSNFKGVDCMTPIIPNTRDLKVTLGVGIGVSGSVLVLALIGLYFAWKRASRPPVWLIPRADFAINSYLSRGGYSMVFLGTWKSTKVAVKVVKIPRRGVDISEVKIEMKDILIESDPMFLEDQATMRADVPSGSTGPLSGTNTRTSKKKLGSKSILKSSSKVESFGSDATLPTDSRPDLIAKSPSGKGSGASEKYIAPNEHDSSTDALLPGAVRSNSLNAPGTTSAPNSMMMSNMLSGNRPRNTVSWKLAQQKKKSTGTTRASRSLGVSRRHDVLNEVNIVSKLRHPNLVFMIAASFYNEHLFMLIEYMDAGSLYEALRNKMLELSPSVRIRIMLDACRGLSFLHQQNPPVLHMDLKTPNILIDSHFTAKITDFGLSAVKSKVATEGTIPWTAPEVLRGEVYTPASDVYSMALVLWEVMLTEPAIPWGNLEREAIAENVKAGQRPPLDDANCPLGPKYAQLVRRAWSQNPADRPDAMELVEELEEILVDAESIDNKRSKDGRMRLLHLDLPDSMREEIMRGVEVTPVQYANVTLIFTDIVGFTKYSSERTAEEVSEMLSNLHDGTFDQLVQEHGAFHLETIGDAYIVACNFPRQNSEVNHAAVASRLGLAMARACKKFGIQIRVGINTGPAVATIVGKLHPKMTLLGDTVNAASRMEHVSPPGMVTITRTTYEMIRDDAAFKISSGNVEDIKGKGKMKTYRVLDWDPSVKQAAPAYRAESSSTIHDAIGAYKTMSVRGSDLDRGATPIPINNPQINILNSSLSPLPVNRESSATVIARELSTFTDPSYNIATRPPSQYIPRELSSTTIDNNNNNNNMNEGTITNEPTPVFKEASFYNSNKGMVNVKSTTSFNSNT